MARRNGAADERRLGVAQFVRWIPADRDRPIGTVPLIMEVPVGLQATEIFQDIGEPPPGIPQGGPAVVVLRRAPECEARVRGRAPAHDAGSRYGDATIEILIGEVTPVVTDRWFGR